MIEFYNQIRFVHIWAISISGFLFFLRAFFSLIGANWPRNFALRMLVYLVDITLLTAAAMLWTILPKEIFENGWLHLKITLVVFYIIAGFGAMREKFTKNLRIGFCFLAALFYFLIIGIARAHNPLGWLI
jgi:uncharacterized membrane protein SirB2